MNLSQLGFKPKGMKQQAASGASQQKPPSILKKIKAGIQKGIQGKSPSVSQTNGVNNSQPKPPFKAGAYLTDEMNKMSVSLGEKGIETSKETFAKALSAAGKQYGIKTAGQLQSKEQADEVLALIKQNVIQIATSQTQAQPPFQADSYVRDGLNKTAKTLGEARIPIPPDAFKQAYNEEKEKHGIQSVSQLKDRQSADEFVGAVQKNILEKVFGKGV